MTGNFTGGRSALRTFGVVLVVLGLTVQAGAAQMSVAQGDAAVADSTTVVSVETTWADGINETSVVAAGNVTSLADNESATVWLEYRTNGSTTWQSTAQQTVDSVGPFREVLTGLESGATYEYRARAAGNSSSGVNGSVETFTVPDNPPVVETGPAERVTESSARLTATVEWLGNADSAEVVFVVSPVGSDTTVSTSGQTITDSGSVGETVRKLRPNTTYEAVAHVHASDGDNATAGPVQFTTDTQFVVTTDGVGTVNETAVRLSGSVVDLGGADSADVGFEYRERGATEWMQTAWTTVTAPGTVNETLTGLSPETTYEVRATGAAVDNDRATGETLTVATDSAFAVSTDSATVVNDTAVTVDGGVTDLGGADAATVTVEYRRAGTSEWLTARRTEVASTGDVSATVTGLEAGTDYEVRVTGSASDGDRATGAVRTVTTDRAASAPAVDSFTTDQKRSPNPHLEFTADWDVSDADGDLDTVTVEVVDSDGRVVRTATTSVSGGSASGADSFKLKHVRNQRFTVRLTVTDESGHSTTETRTVAE